MGIKQVLTRKKLLYKRENPDAETPGFVCVKEGVSLLSS